MPLFLVGVITVAIYGIVARRVRPDQGLQTQADAAVVADSAPSDPISTLINKLGQDEGDLRVTLENAPNDQVRREAIEAHRNQQETAWSLLSAVQGAARTNLAVAALTQIMLRFPNTDLSDKAAQQIVDRHLDDVSLEGNLGLLEQSGSEQAQKVLEKAYQKSPIPSVQARAAYALASLLKFRSEKNTWHNPAGARTEADQAARLFQDVVARHGNFYGSLGRLGDLAQSQLKEMDMLAVGRVAPEIEGQSLHGQTMRLSDYRGKVVVLSFWGYWCPLCRLMFPHERELIKRMEGRPFVFVGVNADQDANIPRSLEVEGKVTWKSWRDPGEVDGGTIARSWNVRELPDFYILDDRGVIRDHVGPHTDDHGRTHFLNAQGVVKERWQDRADEMFEVVEALVREVEQRQSAEHKARE